VTSRFLSPGTLRRKKKSAVPGLLQTLPTTLYEDCGTIRAPVNMLPRRVGFG
jgi:hypothetical protein